MFATARPPPTAWLDAPQRRAARGRRARGRPAADPRRRRAPARRRRSRARVAVLLERGVPAERILLLTFTRRAAREMLARVDALRGAGAAGADRVVGGTFHAVGWHARAGPRGGARPAAVARRCSTRATPPTCSTSCARSTGLATTGRRFAAQAHPASTSTAARSTRSARCRRSWPRRTRGARTHSTRSPALFRAYTARKRALGLLDLDDLLLYWRALALARPDVGPLLAARFDHVLVDEYQDVNGLQADIVDGARAASTGSSPAWATTCRRSTASARPAPDHMLGLPRAASRTRRVVTLEQNYRSTQPILAAANVAAHAAKTPYPRTLRARRPSGEPPELVWCDDEATPGRRRRATACWPRARRASSCSGRRC